MDDKKPHESARGTYIINIIYLVIFFLGYLFMFYELSLRWAVR